MLVLPPCGCSSMVEQQPSKLNTRVRFPSPAPSFCAAKKSEPQGTIEAHGASRPRQLFEAEEPVIVELPGILMSSVIDHAATRLIMWRQQSGRRISSRVRSPIIGQVLAIENPISWAARRTFLPSIGGGKSPFSPSANSKMQALPFRR